MAKTEKADKAKEEARQELEKAKIEAAKMKDIFASEWNEVVERSLKDQNDVTINQSQHVRMKSADKKERNQQA
jgi:ubiquinone biosynthesis protein Coq4